ncbi:MAG: lysine 5,6-aminomutase subunit alpha [Candidatus Cloacimonetes bacterium]|nr:lysine 5,6-aminomutase subunit alpha [Candidatus Cloacimonadota bacterium]
MIRLSIDKKRVDKARGYARDIAISFQELIEKNSSVTIERTVARLMGVDGALPTGEPLPNLLVEHLRVRDVLSRGVAYWLTNGMLVEGTSAKAIAEKVAAGELDLTSLPAQPTDKILEELEKVSSLTLKKIRDQRCIREDAYIKYGPRNQPAIYVIVATGNIYEDVVQAQAAVRQGADIIAVIRSTAQSLLDYVPFGATTTGFGGTYATQENFRIMRQALDEVGEEVEKYISLTNYASGLCMPEIAAMGALERLDIMLNDAMYGILFRDINMKRTFLDQYFSRMINAYAGIEIQTGEDNYLTTSDAIESAYTVTASQLINEQFALMSGLRPEKMGLGHAFEIDPEIENSVLYEIAHAFLTKTLFPDSPVKYMPPTRFASGNIFKTYLMNGMFNMVAQITGQGVQLLGMMTEAIHTPHLADRGLAIENAQYIFKAVKSFPDEFILQENGFINQRANRVLDEASEFLSHVKEIGLMQALSEGAFAEIKRSEHTGRGLEGVFFKDTEYVNPFMDKMKSELFGSNVEYIM